MDLFSPRHLLIILVIVLLVFGTKKLKSIGSDLGGAVRGFKKAMKDGDEEQQAAASTPTAPPQLNAPGQKDAEFPSAGDAAHSDRKPPAA